VLSVDEMAVLADVGENSPQLAAGAA
jgi:hypothetical protein